MKISRLKDFLAFVFVFDCAVLPVFKVFGMTFKISYLIGFIFLFGFFLSEMANRNNLKNSEVHGIGIRIIFFVLLAVFGEFFFALLEKLTETGQLIKLIIGCLLMVGSLYFGYALKNKRFNFLFYCLIINNVVNILLALLGRMAPGFLLKIYAISVDTYIDGYYRNGGIIGNPNATLLIMNMLLLAIVVLYSKGLLKLGSIKIVICIIMPLFCDIAVSSRGELIQTVLIEAYFVYSVFKKQKKVFDFVKIIIVSAVVTSVSLLIFNFVILPKYPNIRLSIDRLTEIEEITQTDSNEMTDTVARPFYKWDVFINRFKVSPVWGSGTDAAYSNVESFAKGTTGYHNDWFLVLATSGIAGFLLWIGIIKKGVHHCGFILLTPIVTTALSNTFIQSWAGTMLYFFTIGVVLRQGDNGDATPSRIRFKLGR